MRARGYEYFRLFELNRVYIYIRARLVCFEILMRASFLLYGEGGGELRFDGASERGVCDL